MEYTIYGAEGKAEEKYIKKLLERLCLDNLGSNCKAVALVGVNPYKSNKRELDIILILSWDTGARINVESDKKISKYCTDKRRTIDLTESEVVFLNSCSMTIEIKSHDASGIKIEGNDLYVHYEKWSCVTDKLIEQAKSGSEFLKDQFGINERFGHFIYLPEINKNSVTANEYLEKVMIYNDTTFSELITKHIQQMGVIGNCDKSDNKKTYSRVGSTEKSLHNESNNYLQKIKNYYKQLKPALLEQEKLEYLSRRFIESSKEWCQYIDKKTISFTGRAGTGKTVKLLRTAKDLAEDNMENVLLLTFNRALARDLQRLMQLQKISSGIGITILTIDQFLFRVAYRVKILSEHEVKEYQENSGVESENKDIYNAVRELLQEALQKNENIAKVKEYYNSYTMVAIDEAQDWFEEERNIILSIFQPNKILIAAGTDQCLRAPTMANWKGDIQKRGFDVHPVPSNIALRQTTSLSDFCNLLATKIGLAWSVQSNNDLLGGEIILFESFNKEVLTYFLHELEDNKNHEKYFPIDYLLLQSNRQGQNDVINARYKFLENNKVEYWDAVTEKDRNELPVLNKVRSVSLESCRGLEGWSTIIFDLDHWVDFCIKKEKARNENFAFDDLVALPTWFLIPFTRAKKRMIIELPRKRSDLRDILLGMHKDNPDTIKYIK
ncbi:MAG: AAA family ATPase [Spirochaetia bacterium]|nr:AAA family ATPase [Spirochaetia bacterium]